MIGRYNLWGPTVVSASESELSEDDDSESLETIVRSSTLILLLIVLCSVFLRYCIQQSKHVQHKHTNTRAPMRMISHKGIL